MRMRLWIALACMLGCASDAVPADAPMDWARGAEPWSVHIVTRDLDGDERVTRIWLASMDGIGAIRTGDSRWWQNLTRDPHGHIRLKGRDYPVRFEPVTDFERKARIDDAFLEKYGWQESLLFWEDRGETHENYALLLVAPAAAASADGGAHAIGVAREVFVDASRPTKASPPFPGSPERRLDTWIWYPAAAGKRDPRGDPAIAEGGPWPLIVYSHGTYGRPDDASHFCEFLARTGYVVAAPAFPLTSSVAHTGLPAADISDAGSQPDDVGFVIDSLLSHPRFGPMIDAERIGATGISLGGIVTYFASFGIPARDPRIKASAPIAAGDPPYAALGFGLGFAGTVPAPVSVPVLLLAGDADLFTAATGGYAASYARLLPPRYMVEIHGAPHVWFGDRADVPPGGLNPDCLWFEEHTGQRPPLCARRRPLIAPATQKAIVRHALRAFFDGYLKSDAAALEQLRTIGASFADVTLQSDEFP